LHLAPQTFWSLSLPEWRALTHRQRPSSLTREDFDALSQAYPDHSHAQ
jgi:hypothetical protein